MNECLFLGNYFTDIMIEKFSRYASLSLGNDNYEKGFLRILSKVFDKVYSISAPAVPTCSRTFPFLKIRGFKISQENIESTFVTYLNLKFLSTKRKASKKMVFETIKTHNIKYVFISTYHYAWILKLLKKAFPDVKIIFLLPDLPNVIISKKHIYFLLYLRKVNKELNKSLSEIDLLLPITNYQKDLLDNFHGRTLVYESFYDCSLFNNINVEKKQQILYAGSLNESYGIMDLINAFIKLDNSQFTLTICGKGDCENNIKTISERYRNIVFLNYVSKENVRILEKESMLIVCPDKHQRKYSFHSRYLEYLCSGTPVLTYKPVGAKKEYFEYFNYIDEYDDITTALQVCLNKKYDDALKKAAKGAEFMRTIKNINYFASELKNNLEKI